MHATARVTHYLMAKETCQFFKKWYSDVLRLCVFTLVREGIEKLFRFMILIYSRCHDFVPLPLQRYRDSLFNTVTKRYRPLLTVTEFYRFLCYKRYRSE
jgi:hypothetical protein